MMHSDKADKHDSAEFADAYTVKDPERFAANVAKALDEAGKAAAAWTRAREAGEGETPGGPLVDMVQALSSLANYWLSNPSRALEAQTRLLTGFMAVWANSISNIAGEPSDAPIVEPDRRDRRFRHPDWQQNPFFSFLMQAYLVLSRWASELVEEAEGLDEDTRRKARFYVRQATEALSPSNFLITNPQVLRETMTSRGANLVEGMRRFSEDLAEGKGMLRLRQTDEKSFELGRNLAMTPGRVVARSALAEIIQYAPATSQVLRRPLVIVPPWINKYYVLDLSHERSFIKWAVSKGHTVFVISWINPDERHAEMGWEAYIRDGVELAVDTALQRCGTDQVNAVGYCVGGTLLTAALALMAQENDDRLASATLLATQVDFTHAGDLKVFVDKEQLAALEKVMAEKGFLEGSYTAAVFNMLRARDLLWPYVVDNYLRGRDPLPFDLLYWNSDTTRLTAANHAYYLRNCYVENNLAAGRMELHGKKLSLSDITVPVYNLAAIEDHIAPAKSVRAGSNLFGGPVEFVLSGSGHIAGIINPPSLAKYHHWTGGQDQDLEEWLKTAKKNPGSWWQHWQAWIESLDDERVPARKLDSRKRTFGAAPGEYVRVRN